MSPLFVVSRTCPNPDCKMLSHWPYAKFQALVQGLKGSSTGEFLGVVLCDACNLVSSCSSTISPPHMYDIGSQPQSCFYENLFVVPSKCVEQTCETPVQVLAPKMAHYIDSTDLVSEMFLWKIADDALCPSDHKLQSPASHLADNFLKHERKKQ